MKNTYIGLAIFFAIVIGYGIGFSQQRNEDNEKDGQKRQTTEIVAYRMDVNQRQEEPALG